MLVGAVVLLAGSGRRAHVTVDPRAATKGDRRRRVGLPAPQRAAPGDVIGLRVQFPTAHPITVLSPASTPGWTVTTRSSRSPTRSRPTTARSPRPCSRSIGPADRSRPASSASSRCSPKVCPTTSVNSRSTPCRSTATARPSPGSTAFQGRPDPRPPAPVLTLTATGVGAGGILGHHHIHAGGRRRHHDGALGRRHELAGRAVLISAGFAAALLLMVLWLNRPSMRPTPDPTDGQ